MAGYDSRSVGEFEDDVASWRHQTFPSGGTTDAQGELHADLALADHWVAEAVIPFVERGSWRPPSQIDVTEELRKVRDRAVELGRESDGEDKVLADAYLDYAKILTRVYESYLAQGQGIPDRRE
jgi:hypothetical protein